MQNSNHVQKDTNANAQPVKYYLPRGVKFSDIYVDGQEVSTELNISKRTLRKHRSSGLLSYTHLFGKIYYYRQEIAAILAGGKTNNNRKHIRS